MSQHWKDRDEESHKAILMYVRGKDYKWRRSWRDALGRLIGIALGGVGLLSVIRAWS